ncbi:MAG: DNA adenine methylase [Planctomycetia bacterium]|nr:DNA adenine methylase [Planctomycetia bacterium]
MTIQTQGVKYAGSKKRLLPQILDVIESTGARSVWDAFSGTTRVSQALAQKGFRTFSSDISLWSEIFGTCWLLNMREPETYAELIDHLNHVPSQDGWFTENYGGDVRESETENCYETENRYKAEKVYETGNGNHVNNSDNTKKRFVPCPTLDSGVKRPFQRKNMRKLDGIRAELDRLALDSVTYAVAMTALMLALDRVDNTLGHFSSYLRDWAPRSYQDLTLTVPYLWVNREKNKVFRGDVFSLTPKIHADLAYFDPPYGSNNEKMPPSRVRYAAYYHFWTTLIRNDQPELFGRAQRRKDSSDLLAPSIFEEFRKNPETGRFLAVEAIQRLLHETDAQWILLSYSSGGRATASELLEAVHSVGELCDLRKIDYQQNVMANMKWTNEWLREKPAPNQEFLFLIEKSR